MRIFTSLFLLVVLPMLPLRALELVKRWEIDTQRTLNSAQMAFAGSDGSMILTISRPSENFTYLWVSPAGSLIFEITAPIQGIFLFASRSNVVFVGTDSLPLPGNPQKAIVWSYSDGSVKQSNFPIDGDKYIMGVSYDLFWGHFSHHRELVPPPILVQKGSKIICYALEGDGLYPTTTIDVPAFKPAGVTTSISNPTPKPSIVEASSDLKHWAGIGTIPAGSAESKVVLKSTNAAALFLRTRSE